MLSLLKSISISVRLVEIVVFVNDSNTFHWHCVVPRFAISSLVRALEGSVGPFAYILASEI